jgi:hypothetical protein
MSQEVQEILLQPYHLKEILVETHCPQMLVALVEEAVVVVQVRLAQLVMPVEMVEVEHQI